MEMDNKKKLFVAGFSDCGFFQKAKTLCSGAVILSPTKYSLELLEFDDRSAFLKFLEKKHTKSSEFDNEGRVENHTTSPFVWYERGDHHLTFIGGFDDTLLFFKNAPKASSFLAKEKDWKEDENMLDGRVAYGSIVAVFCLFYFVPPIGKLIIVAICLFLVRKYRSLQGKNFPPIQAMLSSLKKGYPFREAISLILEKRRFLENKNNKLAEEGKPAPNFRVLSLDGKSEFRLTDLAKKSRPLVINFGSCT